MLKCSSFLIQYKKSRNILEYKCQGSQPINKSVLLSVSKFRHNTAIRFPFIQDKRLSVGGKFSWRRNLLQYFPELMRLEQPTPSRCHRTSGVPQPQTSCLIAPQMLPGKSCLFLFALQRFVARLRPPTFGRTPPPIVLERWVTPRFPCIFCVLTIPILVVTRIG